MPRFRLLFALIVLALGSCAPEAEPPVVPADYVAEVDAWHADREDRLRSDTGWLNLAGLYWLDDGVYSFGSAPDNDVVFPKGPERIGRFTVADSTVRVEIEPGVEVMHADETVTELAMATDLAEEPTVLHLGSLRWYAIVRDGRLAIRLRDLEHPYVTDFEGIERYPVDPAWRLDAVLEAHDEPILIDVPTVMGTVSRQESPGALVFTVDDERRTLDAVAAAEGRLFIIFADATTGAETYGGGRFVYTDAPDAEGRTILDFNKAYNPPCALSEFSTCPLPPPQNRLPFAIRAGELNYENPYVK